MTKQYFILFSYMKHGVGRVQVQIVEYLMKEHISCNCMYSRIEGIILPLGQVTVVRPISQ